MLDITPRIGTITKNNKIYVIIGLYYECAYLDVNMKDNFEPELSAIMFANSIEEVNQLMKSYPKFKYYLTGKLLHKNYDNSENLEIKKFKEKMKLLMK